VFEYNRPKKVTNESNVAFQLQRLFVELQLMIFHASEFTLPAKLTALNQALACAFKKIPQHNIIKFTEMLLLVLDRESARPSSNLKPLFELTEVVQKKQNFPMASSDESSLEQISGMRLAVNGFDSLQQSLAHCYGDGSQKRLMELPSILQIQLEGKRFDHVSFVC
jgi:hypothetical protein